MEETKAFQSMVEKIREAHSSVSELADRFKQEDLQMMDEEERLVNGVFRAFRLFPTKQSLQMIDGKVQIVTRAFPTAKQESLQMVDEKEQIVTRVFPTAKQESLQMVDEKEQILTLTQAAKFMGVSYTTIRRQALLARIPAFKVGSQWRIRRSKLIEKLEKVPMRRARKLKAVR